MNEENKTIKNKPARAKKSRVITENPTPAPKEAPPISQTKPQEKRIPGLNHKTSI